MTVLTSVAVSTMMYPGTCSLSGSVEPYPDLGTPTADKELPPIMDG